MSKLPVKPIKPNDDLKNRDEKSRQEWGKYFDDYKEWESKAAVIGRKYGDQYIHDLSFNGNQQLVNWLKANNAPAEVVTVAENVHHLQYSYLEYANGRRIMDDSAAASRAELAIETFRAIKKISVITQAFRRLAPRERQVFDMITGGVKTAAIAVELGISPRTVKTYKKKINCKFAKVEG